MRILKKAMVETIQQISIEDIPDNFEESQQVISKELTLHPFLDKVYFQIAKKSMYVMQLDQAHHFLDLLMQGRELQYGQ